MLIINQKMDSLHDDLHGTIFEPISWIGLQSSHHIKIHNPIVVSRDKDCPYRQATLAYIKTYADLKTAHIIEVDNLEALIHIVEMGKAIAIMPQQITKIYPHIQCLESHTLHNVTLYIYSHHPHEDLYHIMKKRVESQS